MTLAAPLARGLCRARRRGVLPDLQHRRIAQAVVRQEANLASAKQEVGLIAAANARTNMVERGYKDVRNR